MTQQESDDVTDAPPIRITLRFYKSQNSELYNNLTLLGPRYRANHIREIVFGTYNGSRKMSPFLPNDVMEYSDDAQAPTGISEDTEKSNGIDQALFDVLVDIVTERLLQR